MNPPVARRNPTAATVAALALAGLATIALVGCEDARAPAAPSAASPATSPAAPAPDSAAPPAPATAEAPPSAAAGAATAPAAAPAAAKTVGGLQDITFDTVKFAMEKNDQYQPSLLTPAIKALDGRNVRIRGYILPSFQQTGLTQFVLVRDNMQCCFGPGAMLYDCMVVEMKPGKSTDYTVRPVAVEGRFELRDFLDPTGKPLAIYHLDGDAVKQ